MAVAAVVEWIWITSFHSERLHSAQYDKGFIIQTNLFAKS
jgi:hypothetical protein